MRVKKVNATRSAQQNKSTVEASANVKYSEATQYIRCAISALSADAKQDVLAKESIANLSVVLLDLSNN